jgi:hypothetical protein
LRFRIHRFDIDRFTLGPLLTFLNHAFFSSVTT